MLWDLQVSLQLVEVQELLVLHQEHLAVQVVLAAAAVILWDPAAQELRCKEILVEVADLP
jgi:hypothetical protein